MVKIKIIRGSIKLFKEYPISVALRMILSHFYIFFPNKNKMHSYEGGKIFLNLHESWTMINRILGTHEYFKTRLLKKVIKPGMVFVDVGVCRGYFSFLAAKHVKKNGKVFSFEPDPNNCYWIKEGIKMNQYDNITLVESALYNKNGYINLYTSDVSGRHSIKGLNNKNGFTRVKIIKLDSYLEKHKIKKIDMIKIDVEGADLEVIQGMKIFLKNTKKLHLFMDIHKGVNCKEIQKILISSGFDIYGVSKKIRKIDSFNDSIGEIYARKQKIYK